MLFRSACLFPSHDRTVGNIFRSWYNLTESEREQWAYNASIYPLKDKFGNTKYLTGRQLYTKLNAQLLPAKATSDVKSFDPFVELAPVNIYSFDINDNSLKLHVDGAFDNQFIYISIYQLRRRGRVKPHAHFKRTAVLTVVRNSTIDIWDEFSRQFPLSENGQTFGFNIQFVNASGVMTSVLAFTAVAGLS